MGMNPDAAQRREDARDRDSGQFGEHAHSEPELTLSADEEELWEPGPPVFAMPAYRLAEAIKRIDRANRRLERAGVAERFEYETEEYIHHPEDEPFGVPAVRLTLNAPRISSGEWTFTAAHEMTADGHIVSFGGARIDEMRCDHCGHNRRRGKVYTVTNKDGEVMVVGSNCLGAFLGVRPEGLWTLTFDLEAAEQEGEDDEWRIAARTGDIVLPAVDLIGAGLAASKDGEEFVPKSRSSREHPATAFLVERDLRTLVAAGEEPERRAAADTILAWVNEQPDGESDYIDSLRSVLAGKERWVGRKHFGIAVSAISAHKNAREWKLRDAQRLAEHEELYQPGHIGEVGVRFRDVPMTVMVVDVSPGDLYGPTTRMVLRDNESGRQVIWWASGDRSSWKVGDAVIVTATVKEQGEFRGTDQTIVSRANLTAVVEG